MIFKPAAVTGTVPWIRAPSPPTVPVPAPPCAPFASMVTEVTHTAGGVHIWICPVFANAIVPGSHENVAVTLCICASVATQVVEPEHAPLHPMNVVPVVDDAVSVTIVLASNSALHVAPQSMPAGVEVTEPTPVPIFVTVN